MALYAGISENGAILDELLHKKLFISDNSSPADNQQETFVFMSISMDEKPNQSFSIDGAVHQLKDNAALLNLLAQGVVFDDKRIRFLPNNSPVVWVENSAQVAAQLKAISDAVQSLCQRIESIAKQIN